MTAFGRLHASQNIDNRWSGMVTSDGQLRCDFAVGKLGSAASVRWASADVFHGRRHRPAARQGRAPASSIASSGDAVPGPPCGSGAPASGRTPAGSRRLRLVACPARLEPDPASPELARLQVSARQAQAPRVAWKVAARPVPKGLRRIAAPETGIPGFRALARKSQMDFLEIFKPV